MKILYFFFISLGLCVAVHLLGGVLSFCYAYYAMLRYSNMSRKELHDSFSGMALVCAFSGWRLIINVIKNKLSNNQK